MKNNFELDLDSIKGHILVYDDEINSRSILNNIIFSNIQNDFKFIVINRQSTKTNSQLELLKVLNETYLWDINNSHGLHFNIDVSDFGPLLLSTLLELTEIQSNAIYQIFNIADKLGLLLYDLGDLVSVLEYFILNYNEVKKTYILASKKTLNSLLQKVNETYVSDINKLFYNPQINIDDLFIYKNQCNIISCLNLDDNNIYYATLILWVLVKISDFLPKKNDEKVMLILNNFNKSFNSLPNSLKRKCDALLSILHKRGCIVIFVEDKVEKIDKALLSNISLVYFNDLLRYYSKVSKLSLLDDFCSNEIGLLLSELKQNKNIHATFDLTDLSTELVTLKSFEDYKTLNPNKVNSVEGSLLYEKYSKDYNPVSANEVIEKISNKSITNVQKESKVIKSRSRDTVIVKALKSAATSIGREFGLSLARGVLDILNKSLKTDDNDRNSK